MSSLGKVSHSTDVTGHHSHPKHDLSLLITSFNSSLNCYADQYVPIYGTFVKFEVELILEIIIYGYLYLVNKVYQGLSVVDSFVT